MVARAPGGKRPRLASSRGLFCRTSIWSAAVRPGLGGVLMRASSSIGMSFEQLHPNGIYGLSSVKKKEVSGVKTEQKK